MDKLEKLEKGRSILQQEIDSIKANEQQRNEETEILLNSDVEAIEGGVEVEEDLQQSCGFFCLKGTF